VMLDEQPWVDALKAMPFATTWAVTLKNRTKLAAEILKWLNG
jgi:nucleoside-triphosphatase THEP1